MLDEIVSVCNRLTSANDFRKVSFGHFEIENNTNRNAPNVY